MKNIEKALKKALYVIKKCTLQKGYFYASGLKGGYEALWSRDSIITSLGASIIDGEFKIPFKKSLELLSKNQSRHGQIPNAIGSYNIERHSDVTFNSIDSSLWYIIGHYVYAKSYNDKSLLKKYKKNMSRTLTWLNYQDPNEDGLLVQQPTMDWQDAFPHKYGRTINTQALYYAVLKMTGDLKIAEHLKRVVNGDIEKYLSLYDKKLGYYRPWIWKDHSGDRESEEWFDTLGNLLAIVTGLANPKIARKIINYIEKNKINKPYPCKAIYPPIRKGGREWRSYFSTSDARTPYEYLNAGIWPFIGGFYIAALVKIKMYKKAKKELEMLAKANKKVGGDAFNQGLTKKDKWGFQEWLHGKTGQAIPHSNPYQGWSAGTYIYAYECVKKRKVLYF